MSKASNLSLLLVFLQFICIGSLAFTGPVLPRYSAGAALVWSGAFIGIWALLEMSRSKFRIVPEVSKGAHLVTTGPYRFVRNPMYLSVLLLTLGWIFARQSLLRWSTWIVLAFVLVSKLLYEERFLAQAFDEYKNYAAKTKRLLPFLW